MGWLIFSSNDIPMKVVEGDFERLGWGRHLKFHHSIIFLNVVSIGYTKAVRRMKQSSEIQIKT
jgi:hypothetical protein